MKTDLVCSGSGLVALDYIVNGNPKAKPKLQAGGSCGNVLTGLSFLGWRVYPIARLSRNKATSFLENDLKKWDVKSRFISKTNDGSTPVIIHRIYKTNGGEVKHRFEFKDPSTKKWLPSYKPVLAKKVPDLKITKLNSKVFYFDKVSAGNIELAKEHKKNGALIFFEPSGIKDIKQFRECLKVADILKYSNERLVNLDELLIDTNVLLEVETLGSDGLRYRKNFGKKSNWKKLKPYKIDFIKDAAGSGDWCSVGIIAKLGRNGLTSFLKATKKELEDALNFGQALAALNCKFEGARGLMYFLDNILLNKYLDIIKKRKMIELQLPETAIKQYKKINSFHEIYD